MKLYRQGDVLLVRRGYIPKGLPQAAPEGQGRLVLARGEATGHHHSVPALPEVALFRPDDMPAAGGSQWLKVRGEVQLEHQEHEAITLPPGMYEVIQQREWTEEEPRKVED